VHHPVTSLEVPAAADCDPGLTPGNSTSTIFKPAGVSIRTFASCRRQQGSVSTQPDRSAKARSGPEVATRAINGTSPPSQLLAWQLKEDEISQFPETNIRAVLQSLVRAGNRTSVGHSRNDSTSHSSSGLPHDTPRRLAASPPRRLAASPPRRLATAVAI